MLTMDIDNIIKAICKATGVTEDLVKDKITEKKKTLNDLVSDEGAAYIVASDLGVNLLGDLPRKKIKIKDVVVGMRGINITGRIMQIYDLKEFTKKDGKPGKVVAMTIGDETGRARLVLWDELTEQAEKLKVNDVIRVTNAYARENKYSGRELHLGARSSIETVSDNIDIPVAAEISTQVKEIKDAQPNDTIQGRGILIQAYRPSFYTVCGECGASIKDGECKEHPKAEKKKEMVLSFMFDDGEECIRCVCFRETAEKIVGLSASEATALIVDKSEMALQEYIDTNLLGRVVSIQGRLKYNQSFNRNEILVTSCSELSSEDIIKSLER